MFQRPGEASAPVSRGKPATYFFLIANAWPPPLPPPGSPAGPRYFGPITTCSVVLGRKFRARSSSIRILRVAHRPRQGRSFSGMVDSLPGGNAPIPHRSLDIAHVTSGSQTCGKFDLSAEGLSGHCRPLSDMPANGVKGCLFPAKSAHRAALRRPSQGSWVGTTRTGRQPRRASRTNIVRRPREGLRLFWPTTLASCFQAAQGVPRGQVTTITRRY